MAMYGMRVRSSMETDALQNQIQTARNAETAIVLPHTSSAHEHSPLRYGTVCNAIAGREIQQALLDSECKPLHSSNKHSS